MIENMAGIPLVKTTSEAEYSSKLSREIIIHFQFNTNFKKFFLFQEMGSRKKKSRLRSNRDDCSLG